MTSSQFTIWGWILVIFLLIMFIHSRAVVWLLGVILVGLLLINYKSVNGILFTTSTKGG